MNYWTPRLIAGFAAAVVIAGFVALAVLVAGSGGGGATYVPAAYGQRVGGVFDCYYVDDVGEVADLEAAGLCPAGSEPTVMPLSWEEEYWAYYSSSAYVNTYMPVQYRSHYTSVTVVSFGTHYSSQIKTASTHATYRSSTGTTTTGTSTLKFGSGSSSGSSGGSAVHGGGSARGACSLTMTTVHEKSGTSGSGSSSHGGGSARSGGSSSSKTSSKTGSQGGC